MRRRATGNSHVATLVSDVKVPAQSRTVKTRLCAACKDGWPCEAEIRHVCLLYAHNRCVSQAAHQHGRCLRYRRCTQIEKTRKNVAPTQKL